MGFCQGIFLFAHLVWEILRGQTSIYGLDQEVGSLPTPTDLDKLDKMYFPDFYSPRLRLIVFQIQSNNAEH